MLFALPAFAEESRHSNPALWDSFYQSCDDFLMPGFKDATAEWKAWQSRANETVREMQTFTKQTCPAYYARKQGAETLPAFVAENRRVSTLAVDTGVQGRPVAKLLEERFRAFDADARANDVSFVGNACGRAFAERRDHVAHELAYIEKLAKNLESGCSHEFEASAANVVKRKISALPQAKGPTTPAPRKSTAPKSDITGAPENPPN